MILASHNMQCRHTQRTLSSNANPRKHITTTMHPTYEDITCGTPYTCQMSPFILRYQDCSYINYMSIVFGKCVHVQFFHCLQPHCIKMGLRATGQEDTALGDYELIINGNLAECLITVIYILTPYKRLFYAKCATFRRTTVPQERKLV